MYIEFDAKWNLWHAYFIEERWPPSPRLREVRCSSNPYEGLINQINLYWDGAYA